MNDMDEVSLIEVKAIIDEFAGSTVKKKKLVKGASASSKKTPIQKRKPKPKMVTEAEYEKLKKILPKE